MLGKLINFLEEGAAAIFSPQSDSGVACLNRNQDIRTSCTSYQNPHPVPSIRGYRDFSAPQSGQAKTENLPSGFVRCEPVFSHQTQRTIGYEFMLNNSSQLLGNSVSSLMHRMHDELLLKSILKLDALQFPGDDLFFISLSPDTLAHESIQRLPCRNIVLAFRPERGNADELIPRCRELKNHGFRFACDDFDYSADFHPLLDLVDFFRFEIGNVLDLERKLEQIPCLTEKTLIAKSVHTPEMRKNAHRLSFRHYQGKLFDHSTPSTGVLISRQRAKIIVIMNMLRNHVESSEIEETMRQDVVLSSQLLGHINSPANGLVQEVHSIAEAMKTMSRDTLYRWFAVLLFHQSGPEYKNTLLDKALLRGRLTELLGQRSRSMEQKNELFVTGMLSLLDRLFELPPETVLKHFSLSTPVEQALLDQNGPYAPYLKLAIAYENHDQVDIGQHAEIAGIKIEQINTNYVKAQLWAREINN